MKKILVTSFIFFLLISFTVVFANVYHGEAPPARYFPMPTKADAPAGLTPEKYDLFVRFLPGGPAIEQGFGINVYSNINIVARGYQLNYNDDVCVGDTIEFKRTLSGEWFAKGGFTDSPPIKWEKDGISLGSALSKQVYGKVCYYFRSWCNYVTVSCSENCQASGNIADGMAVSQEETLSFSLSCPISCTASGYATPDMIMSYPEFKNVKKVFNPVKIVSFGFNENYVLNPVTESTGPNVVVEQVIKPSDESLEDTNKTIKIVVQNNGDMTALLQNATLNVPSRVLYMPKKLTVENSSEIVIQTSSTDDLKLTLNYKSEKLGCLTTKDFEKVIDLEDLEGQKPCKTDADCKSGFICCQKKCRDPATGICKDVNGDGIPDWVPND